MIEYRVGKLSYEEIRLFLNEVDATFSPPLSKKVDLDYLADKLAQFSEFSYCFEKNQIIGLISCYLNRPPEAFISIACVRSEYQNSGIFKELFHLLISKLKLLQIKIIRLEVFDCNDIAQKVYKKVGFTDGGIASKDSHYYVKLIEPND